MRKIAPPPTVEEVKAVFSEARLGEKALSANDITIFIWRHRGGEGDPTSSWNPSDVPRLGIQRVRLVLDEMVKDGLLKTLPGVRHYGLTLGHPRANATYFVLPEVIDRAEADHKAIIAARNEADEVRGQLREKGVYPLIVSDVVVSNRGEIVVTLTADQTRRLFDLRKE